MSIKSRILLLLIQLIFLTMATYIVSGSLAVENVWYFSGLLAIVINPLLLEPWYPKSYDTLANSIIALLLTLTVDQNVAKYGWLIIQIFLCLLIIFSIIQMVYNAKKEGTTGNRIKAIFPLFKIGKAVIIYSAIFWLSVIENYQTTQDEFWILGGCWSLLTISRYINWEQYLLDFSDKLSPISPIGIIGPSTLIITSRGLPKVGKEVIVSSGNIKSKGIIVKRINRTHDIWGQIQLEDESKIGWLVTKTQLNIELEDENDSEKIIGNVGEGTNTNVLIFETNERVNIGDTLCISNYGETVFYQIFHAEIFKFNIKSGAQLDRKIKAFQIGVYDLENQTVRINKSLPSLSEAIYKAENHTKSELAPLSDKFTLGFIKNSSLPINLDINKIKESHTAILGMTGMGKTTLCHRLIKELSKTRRVTVMDQSGEFVSKLGYSKYKKDDDQLTTGVSVCEPSSNSAESALKYLNHLLKLAKNEYEVGVPNPRVLVIDEAHQFIPEPAGMGFNAPGRQESMEFGLNMMQVRKYGISIVFISQRTAVVSKSALSQCENLIAFKSVDQTGLDYLEGILGSGTKLLLPTLSRGEAYVYGPAIDTEKSLVIQTIK